MPQVFIFLDQCSAGSPSLWKKQLKTTGVPISTSKIWHSEASSQIPRDLFLVSYPDENPGSRLKSPLLFSTFFFFFICSNHLGLFFQNFSPPAYISQGERLDFLMGVLGGNISSFIHVAHLHPGKPPWEEMRRLVNFRRNWPMFWMSPSADVCHSVTSWRRSWRLPRLIQEPPRT